MVWVGLLAGSISLGVLCWQMSLVCRANEFLCRSACLVASGFFLKRWIDNWQLDGLNTKLLGWLLILAILPLYLAIRRRRKVSSTAAPDIIPSWQEMFSYLVVPVLFATVMAVGVQVAGTISANKQAAALASAAPLDRSSVILIVADGLRAQSLSLYGHPDKITPSIDRFAESSSTYLAMHANSTTTLPSLLSLLTGRHPLSHGQFNRDLLPRSQTRNLLAVLSDSGYSIGAVMSNGEAAEALAVMRSDLPILEEIAFSFDLFPWLRRAGVYPTRFTGRMFRDIADYLPFFAWPRRAAGHGNITDTLASANELLGQLRPPFFLLVHIHEPHEPYRLSDDILSRLEGVARGAGANLAQLRGYARYSPEFQPIVDVFRELYQSSLKTVDSELNKFLESLVAAPGFANGMVILTADHGESFERGYFLHGEELFENSTRVPLVIRYPRQKKGERVEGLTQSIDIAPTILNVLGIPKPDWMEGQPLKPGSLPTPAASIAINYKHPENGVAHHFPTKFAIWWERYKLIAPCQSGKASLYDLASDPQEIVDIATSESAIAEDLKRRLRDRLARQSAEPQVSCPNL